MRFGRALLCLFATLSFCEAKLVGHWFIDSTLTDQSGNGYDAVFSSNYVAFSPELWFGGVLKQVVATTDPTSSGGATSALYIDLPEGIPYGTAETRTGYIKFSSPNPTGGAIMSFSNPGQGSTSYSSLQQFESVLRFIINHGTIQCMWVGPSMNANEWYHVAMTRNVTDVLFYLNGRSVNVWSNPGSNCTADPVVNSTSMAATQIAGTTSGTISHESPFIGKMFDMRYYDTVLTADEIKALTTATPTPTISFTRTLR
eukprot:NODE_6547_length_838_cov_205.320280_g6311_i0.p1 GENE.NODE_6547_length_838_cov_205.320280_g6311_i0~~NODE_6547_length_838_cov_205.320280_g6311_i0.p1  ORF type:complete len:257 (-),score=35.25 NODE_6547_length_838_cov_205.320280_g6311_i0:5-775(-)